MRYSQTTGGVKEEDICNTSPTQRGFSFTVFINTFPSSFLISAVACSYIYLLCESEFSVRGIRIFTARSTKLA